MNRFNLLISTLVMSATATALSAGGQDKTDARPGVQVARQFANDKFKYSYLLYLPEGYGKEDKKWPVMLFLHGSGESGSDINKVKVHGPPKICEAKKFPFIVVSPQSPGKGWPVEGMNALLDEVLATYKCDEDRVYLTGLSMGGGGAWRFGTEHPERFAAIVPICGGGNDPKQAARLKDMPTWVFHGAKDTTVKLASSQKMVDAIKDAGSKTILFTVYPDANHDSWTATYNNPMLYTWLLAQKRPAKQ